MAKINEEVKDIEVAHIEPTDDTELVEQPDEEIETPAESSTEEKTESDTEEVEESEKETETEENKGVVNNSEVGIKEVPGETAREYALRREVTRLKQTIRDKKKSELLGNIKPTQKISQEQYDLLSEDDKKILEQYDQSELSVFENVLGVIAKKQGWVKKDEFQANTFKERADEVLDDFLNEHQEYMPENDKDNVLWSRFKEEYSLYKEPGNPKDLKRLLNKVHREIFNFQPEEGLKKIDAKQEKIKVASHAGDSSKHGQFSSKQGKIDPSLRQYLKGDFDDLDL